MAEHVLEESDDIEQAASLLRTGFLTSAGGTDDTMVLRLKGELDMATAPGLGRALDTALDGRPSTIALDLTDLTFVDSTGIRVLITGCRRAGVQGCAFVLRSPRRSVLKAIQLTGLDRLMAIEADPSPS